MLSIASCTLLLATTALAVRHHEPYSGIHTHQTPQNYASSGAVYPIDYNDELTIKNPMVRPGNNIIFSFEQIRRDQPSIIDNREEDIGKYIGRRHKTTTTTTTPAAPTTITPLPTTTTASEESSEEFDQEVPVPRPVQPQPIPAQPRHWPTQNLQPVMLPTGTTSKPVFRSFHDFSDSLDIPDSSRIDPKARYPDVNRWSHVASVGTPPPPPTPKWEDFEDSRPHQKQTTNRNYYQPQPTEFVPIHVEETPKPIQQVPQRKVHRHSNRGNRRHSWENVQPSTLAPTVAPYKAPAAPTPASQRGPPPPVPTLTPWSGDRF